MCPLIMYGLCNYNPSIPFYAWMEGLKVDHGISRLCLPYGIVAASGFQPLEAAGQPFTPVLSAEVRNYSGNVGGPRT